MTLLPNIDLHMVNNLLFGGLQKKNWFREKLTSKRG